jgi:hypothetical protein
MAPTKVRSIVQVLLLFDETNSRDYGVSLWAALHEVEAFYKQSHSSVAFKRFYLSSYVPQTTMLDKLANLGRAMFSSDATRSALALLSQEYDNAGTNIAIPLDDSEKKRRNYDQKKLATQIRSLIPGTSEDYNFVIITDRPITPPPSWRYVIWDTVEIKDFCAPVISVAPLDPNYWRDKNPDRISTIKNRARAACMSVTGSLLNLERCENPACFMFEGVDSVTVLDDMKMVGAEHDCSIIKNKGFTETPADPEMIHPPVPIYVS